MSFHNYVGVIGLLAEEHRDETPPHHTILKPLVPTAHHWEHNFFLVNSKHVFYFILIIYFTIILFYIYILFICGTKLLFSLLTLLTGEQVSKPGPILWMTIEGNPSVF